LASASGTVDPGDLLGMVEAGVGVCLVVVGGEDLYQRTGFQVLCGLEEVEGVVARVMCG